VNSIALKTKLGNCKLAISAQVQNDKINEIAEFALQYLIWHVLPAEAYKKDSEFSRDSEFSDDLAEHLTKAGGALLRKFFTDVKLVADKYEKPDKLAKQIKEWVSMGMSEADAIDMAKSVQAKLQSKPEAEVEA
jgi:hypothetical protein